jgi:hypothetical protein
VEAALAGAGEARRTGASARRSRRAASRRRAKDHQTLAAALALFAAVDLAHVLPVLAAGPATHVRSLRSAGRYAGTIASDHQLVVWEVFRNARALLRSPGRFFDAEQCFPTPRSLALGEPMLAMGVLAIPAWLLGADPVAAYNTAFLALPLLAALAMFLLVREWTGSAAAATLAGLLFGFHPARLWDPVHPYAYDSSWSIFAILFAGRWLRAGRWRDALAVAACASLQLGASFYPFVAGALAAGPLALALVWRERLGRVRPAQIVAVAGLVAAFAAWLFAPYLALREAGVLAPRTLQVFAAPGWYLPRAKLFPGVACIALALAAFAVPARGAALGPGGPRLALALGGALAVLVAGGPGWRALAALLPGFDSVRAPETVSRGLHLALAALAGIGCARGLARLPRRAVRPAAAALLAAALAEVLWTGALGPAAVQRFAPARIAPDAEDVRFYAELARAGDAGPILDVPLPRLGGEVFWPGTAPWILLSAYHGRPTSACLSSYLPDTRRLEALVKNLPSPQAVRELADLGFATVVHHHHDLADFESRARGDPRRARIALELRGFEREAARPGGTLRPLHRTSRLAAWALSPPAAPEPARPGPPPGVRGHGRMGAPEAGRMGAPDTGSDQSR